METPMLERRPRSGALSVFGWVMLLTGALGSALGFVNLVVFSLVGRQGGMNLVPPEDLEMMSPVFLKVMDHLTLIIALVWVVCLLTAAAGFAVVRRWDWGRRLSIFLLAASILFTFVGMVIGFRGNAQLQASADLPISPLFMSLYNIGVTLVTVVLHGWIIWWLSTKKIRAEFQVSRSESRSR